MAGPDLATARPATEELQWGYAVQLLSALAAAHLDTDDLEPAQAYSARAVAEARQMGTWTQGILALEIHGTVLARAGSHDLASAVYQEGLDRAETIPFPYDQARLLHAYAQLDRLRHDEPAASAKLSRALAIRKNLEAGQDNLRPRTHGR